MKYLICVLVIVQMCLVYGQDEPTIVKISGNQEKNLGDSVELKCRVADADDYPVVWLKDRGSKRTPQKLSENVKLITQDDRFGLSFNKPTSSYNIKIDDIQPKDVGTYRCEIQLSESNVVSAEVALSISPDGSAF